MQHTRQTVQDHLDVWSRALPRALPVIVQGDLFILLLAEDNNLRTELASLYRDLQAIIGNLALFMGLAGKVEDCAHYHRALNEARQALDVAENLRPATGLCDFSELGVLRLLQAVGERSVIEAFVQQTLGPLIEPNRKQPHTLIDTLDALLQENGNALKAAQRLSIHRNTINQRMQRIEQNSAQSLDDPLFRMNASVALLVWRMSEAQRQERP